MNTTNPQPSKLSYRQIIQAWWPLAASWALMTLEGPAQSAIVARLANAEINLAAWGGVVFPFTLVVAAPIVMLLSASTALSKDYPAYLQLRRFMHRLSFVLTLIHIGVTFTPLYFFVARRLIGAPEEIIIPSRIGLMIITPWTWAIAYRRFNQGVMIRFGHTKAVGIGTAIRLGANVVMLLIGYALNVWTKVTIPGIIVACVAIVTGVIAEGVYSGIRAAPIVKHQVMEAHTDETLTLRKLLAFYVPLALTSLIWIIIQPVGSAAMSRMPNALDSLAAWPVINGLLFLLRSPGMAFNEVVVSLMDKPGATQKLRQFAVVLLTGTSALILLIVLTPLANVWLQTLMALPTNLLAISHHALRLALGLPCFAVLISWYQGRIMHSKATRSITEASIAYSLTMIAILGIGISLQRFIGLTVTIVAYEVAGLAQVIWLWIRRPDARTEHRTSQNKISKPCHTTESNG